MFINREKCVGAITQILKEETFSEEIADFSEAARKIFQCSQVVLEFMDKGVKGLLTGDLNVWVLKKIQVVLEQHSKEL